jgi:hypothetical protein
MRDNEYQAQPGQRMGNKGRRADLSSPAMSGKTATIVFPNAEMTWIHYGHPGSFQLV